MKRNDTWLLLLVPVLMIVGAGCSSPCAGDSLWLDEENVLIVPQGSRQLVFDVGNLPANAQPVLWIAPRIVFVIEERTLAHLVIKVNGVMVGPDRLISGSAFYRCPCEMSWPIPERLKCMVLNGVPSWRVRFDDNFTVGETDIFTWRRSFATEGLEPSLTVDLTGLIREGKNKVELANTLDTTVPRETDLFLPANAEPPIYDLQAKFVRVGLIDRQEIKAYNGAHTRPFDPRPRTFNLLDPDGYKNMTACYARAISEADSSAKRAFFRLVRSHFALWKGEPELARSLLTEMFQETPATEQADIGLFLLGLSQARCGESQLALDTWKRLTNGYPSSPWAEVSLRERVLIDPERHANPVNWPFLEAARANVPIVLDGRTDDAAWQISPVFNNFNVYPRKYERAPVPTELRVLYDEDNLYFAVTCYEPYMDEVRNPNRDRDSSVYNDDCVELFLDPGRTYSQMFEFELGAEGGILDCHNVWEISYLQYDPSRVDKVAKYPDRWCAEMAIPWRELGVAKPAAGDVWLCNVVRNRPRSKNRPGEAYVLGPAADRFAAHESAAWLIFR